MAPREKAENSGKNEAQFHVGFLPDEQSYPLSRAMRSDFGKSTVESIAPLRGPGRDVVSATTRVFCVRSHTGDNPGTVGEIPETHINKEEK